MPEVKELKLSLVFDYPLGSVPSYDLTKCIEHCEDAAYQSEFDDMFVLYSSLASEDFQLFFDAMRFRLSRLKGQILHLDEAQNGSIVLGGIVAGAAFWIIENTLGETLKDAWKESDLHKQIKEILIKNLQVKPKQIASKVKQLIEIDDALNLTVDTDISDEGTSSVVVVIHITPKHTWDPIPSRAGFFK